MTCEIVALVVGVLHKAQSEEVTQLPLVLSYHSVRLLFLTDGELEEGWSDVYPVLPHHVVALPSFVEFGPVLLVLSLLVELCAEILVGVVFWIEGHVHPVQQERTVVSVFVSAIEVLLENVHELNQVLVED